MVIPAASPLAVRLWRTDEFADSKAIWDGLVGLSDADPLFMSWDWQWRWWRHHGPSLRAELRLLGIYSGAKVVGLAPFYVRRATVRGVLHPRRMELIGAAWREPGAIFSDYLDVIAARDSRREVLAAVGGWLRSDQDWDELALCCTKKGGIASELAELVLPSFTHVREVDPMTSWRACLPGQFAQFVERLSPHVRRRLFNQRRKLDGPRVQYAMGREVPEFLDVLWEYSADRWGRKHPGTECRQFYLDVADCMARTGRLRLSKLATRRGALSVMYNVRVGNRVYYLQSAFNPGKSRGISAGYLHFGYAMEDACREGADTFDFLAGAGHHRDYKRDFLTAGVPVANYHAVRGGLGRVLYAAHGVVRECAIFLRSRLGTRRLHHDDRRMSCMKN